MAIDWAAIGQIAGALTVGAGGSWLAARKARDKDISTAVSDLTGVVLANREESNRRFDTLDLKMKDLGDVVSDQKQVETRLTLLEQGVIRTLQTAKRKRP